MISAAGWPLWAVGILFICGLVLIVKGGDLFVDSAVWIAEVSGIPKFIIGATVVSFATTLPELLVSAIGAARGSNAIAIGNAVGSVTANTGLIMAVSIICIPAAVSRKTYSVKSVLLLAATVILFAASAFAEAPLRNEGEGEEKALLEEALTVYFYGVAMGILNASLRLMRVTHFDVQAILYRVSAQFGELCALAMETPLDRMTGYAPMTDILSAVHAGARVRLFMS